MTPLEIFNSYKDILDLDKDSWADPADIWRKLHRAQNEIVRMISRVSPSYFVRSTDITLVSGTSTYSLPQNARLGSKIVLTEDKDDRLQIEKIDWDDHLDLESNNLLNFSSDTLRFSMERNKLRVSPTPTAAETYRIWYIPVFGNMLYGQTAVAASTTTWTAFTADPNYTINYGVVNARADYYNGMQLEVISGNGEGEVHEITDFSGGATPVFTVGGFTTVPNTTSVIAINCPIPEDFHDLVPIRAAMKGAVKQRNRLSDLRSIWNEGKQEMLGWVPNRNSNMTQPDYSEGVY
jgi:hypothetical protein